VTLFSPVVVAALPTIPAATWVEPLLLAPAADACAPVVPAINPVRAAPTSSARIVGNSLDFPGMISTLSS